MLNKEAVSPKNKSTDIIKNFKIKKDINSGYWFWRSIFTLILQTK